MDTEEYSDLPSTQIRTIVTNILLQYWPLSMRRYLDG